MVVFKLLVDFTGSQRFVLYLKMHKQKPVKMSSSAKDMSYLVWFASYKKP